MGDTTATKTTRTNQNKNGTRKFCAAFFIRFSWPKICKFNLFRLSAIIPFLNHKKNLLEHHKHFYMQLYKTVSNFTSNPLGDIILYVCQ